MKRSRLEILMESLDLVADHIGNPAPLAPDRLVFAGFFWRLHCVCIDRHAQWWSCHRYRYDKTARNFLAAVYLTASVAWLS